MHDAPARRNSDHRRKGAGRAARPGRAHTVGLALAGAVLFVFAVIVLVFVVRKPSSANGSSTLPTSSEPAPDIKSLPSAGQSGGVSNLNRGGQFFARVSAKDDPSRLIGEISGEKYEPLENQRIKLERPEGWAFLKSGRTVHVSADSGMAYMPDQGTGARPRDAVLNGHVVIWVFDPLPGGKRPKLGTDAPFAVITTSVLTFDGELNQLKFPEEFVATSEAGSWVATDLTMLFNDVDQRLELLHVTKTKYLTLNPGYESPQPAPAPAPAATTAQSPVAPAATPSTVPAPTPASSAAHPSAPVESLYHLVCTENVLVVQAGRRIEADRLDGWVRLEDNSLRPGAIAGANPTSTKPARKKQPTTPASPSSAPQPPSTNASQPATPAATHDSTPAAPTASPFLPIDDSDPITMTWDGPMEVRPLTSSPGELAHNDVFARFTSEKDGGTTFTDEKTMAVATGALLEYGATRREVALASHEPMGATVTYPGGGVGRAQRFEMSMASGVVLIPTRGIISAESSAASPIFAIGDTSPANAPADPNAPPVTRSLSWTDRADFQLIKNAQQEVTPVLSEVHANGDAKATDGQSFLSGKSLIAQFKPVNPKASRLDHLQVAGQASGGDGQGNTLTSDTLDVAFMPNPEKPEQSDPSVVTAQGSVHAHSVDKKSGELTLSSSYLQTRLSRNIGGALEVTRLDARQSVSFDGQGGLHALCEDLNADPITNTAHLTGPPMTVKVSKDGSTITGQDMTIWNVERKLDSKGRGTLVHDGPIDAPGQAPSQAKTKAPDDNPAHVEATWTRGMTFDDAGTAVCLGDVNAVVTKPPHSKASGELVGLERDTVSADEVHLTFTPPPEDKDIKQDPALGPPAPKPERKLLTIHAVGTPGADITDVTKLARVESRSYAITPTAPTTAPAGPTIDDLTVERILFLMGEVINVDNDKGTLDLPNPGKLLIVDSRAAAAQSKPDMPKPDKTKPDANPIPFDTSSGLRGKTLFTWKGSMSMDRPTGVIHMNDHVVVTQNNDNDDQTKLECDKLTAYIREQQSDAPKQPSDSLKGELTSADAEGAVKLASGTHEVTANTLHYDAIKKIATLTAGPNDIVTINDRKARTQLTSRDKIEWDLANDRIDISKPGTIVAPVDVKKVPTTPKK